MRVVVVGTSGAGKTAMAASIASTLKLPCIELDRLHWEPNWEALSKRSSCDAAAVIDQLKMRAA